MKAVWHNIIVPLCLLMFSVDTTLAPQMLQSWRKLLPEEDKHGQKLGHKLLVHANYGLPASAVGMTVPHWSITWREFCVWSFRHSPRQPWNSYVSVLWMVLCAHTGLILKYISHRSLLNALFATKATTKGRLLIFAVIIAPSTITRDVLWRYSYYNNIMPFVTIIMALFGNAHMRTVVQRFAYFNIHHISKSLWRMSVLQQGKKQILKKIRESHTTW